MTTPQNDHVGKADEMVTPNIEEILEEFCVVC